MGHFVDIHVEKRLSSGIGRLCQELYYFPLLFYVGEHVSCGGMDPITKGSHAGMSLGLDIVRPCNGCPRDVIMFFMEGLVELAKNLSVMLDLFNDCLGLQINLTKSALNKFGLSQEEKIQCARALGMLIDTLAMCHLVLPLTWGRLQTRDTRQTLLLGSGVQRQI